MDHPAPRKGHKGDCSSVAQHTRAGVQSSAPHTLGIGGTCLNPSTQEKIGGLEVQGHPCLYGQFKAIQSYKRPCL